MKLLVRSRGFTIVELLIVIVVIAILAAISIVAYNGVQDRAEASKTASAVAAYKKALQMYKVDKGIYPAAGAFCLGDQYGVFTGQSVPSCRYSTSTIAVTTSASSRDSLKEFMGNNLPMPSTKFITNGTTEYVGGHFYGSSYNYTLDGNPVVAIEYYVKGGSSTPCPVGPVYSVAGAPNFSSSPTVQNTGVQGNGIRCFMLLPND